MASELFSSVVGRVLNPGPTHNVPPLAATGRAGRNLPAAVTSAVVLVGLLAGSLLVVQPLFVVLVGLIALIGVWELAGAFARVDTHLTVVPLYLGSVGMMTCAWMLGAEAIAIALYLTVFSCIVWRLAEQSAHSRISDIMSSIFTAVYVPFLAAFVVLILRTHSSAAVIGTYVTITALNDLGGWAAGVLFGKHPMAPRLSPKKSWEGFAGSILSCVAGGIACFVALGASWWWGIIAGISACLVGTLGDLTESLIKREVGLKDMSRVVPGHGGMLDRVDSLLMTAPIFHVIFVWALA